ncbi:hypothetical protein [Gemmobacter nectariphilus]|uniref:hypothetical protein n=1 Tax=Gemmobacter nectariphilus TaxID=220343 RepID=UPI00040A1B59|nr:hypothetical protein [Gemmobacter nectariphilus]
MATLVATTVAGWLGGAGIGAGFAFGAVTWATVYAQIGTSILFAAISRQLAKRGGAAGESQIELDQPASVIVKRHAYGRSRIEGTPAAVIVRDGVAYCVWILNSRPSDSIETVEFDNRALTLTGDLYDFATGATATDTTFAGHVTLWAGLGDQTTIPDLILSEVGDPLATDDADFWDTDAWRGRTVLWARIVKGKASSAGQRWQRMPPALRVTGKWTPVWDPRDPAQDADDPSTWAWSDNQALCLIDALRHNPVAQLPVHLLHLPSLLRQADVADQAVPLKAGGTEPRYRVGGRIVYSPSVELYQALSPLDVAGGGGLVQIGGMIGYQPGEYLAPSATIDDVLREAPLSFTALQRGRDLPRAIRAIYPNPGAAWEDASLIPIEVPGGGGWTGGDDRVEDFALELVPYPRQANRLAQIRARQLGCQRRIGGVLFPEHLDLVAGANVTLTRPRETDPRAGVYQITAIAPGHWLSASDGVPFRLPFEAREIAASVYAWNPETDEQDVPEETVTQPDLALAPPSDLMAMPTVADLLPAIEFDFLPSQTSSVTGYTWEWRLTGADWLAGGVIAADVPLVAGRVRGRLIGAKGGDSHDLRVKASGSARESEWVTVSGIWATASSTVDAGVY